MISLLIVLPFLPILPGLLGLELPHVFWYDRPQKTGACTHPDLWRGRGDIRGASTQTVAMLQRFGRVSYRALQRQFDLDEAYLEDLKEALLYAYPTVIDDVGRGLIWPSARDASGRASGRVPARTTASAPGSRPASA